MTDFDTNGDGYADTYGYDTNADGHYDTWEYDTNQDGHIDVIGYDVDEDGRLDATAVPDGYTGTTDSWMDRMSAGHDDYSGIAAGVTDPAGAALVESGVEVNSGDQATWG